MANFYAFVQPTGNSGEYLVNLFFTDMQSAFNTSSYLSVGLCSESFADGAASVSGVLWCQQAPPPGLPDSNNTWFHGCINTSDSGTPFYPNNSYTLYAFARDADNGQYWNFNAGTAVQLRIRPVVRNVYMRSNYVAVTLSDLCAQWTLMNFNSIGLSSIDFYDGAPFEFDEGYWEAKPTMNVPQNDAFTAELYLEEGMVAQREYIFFPYARLPNGKMYHLLAPGETITFTYVPAPDGPVTVTGKPENLNVYTASKDDEFGHYVGIDFYYDTNAWPWIWIKITCIETGDVSYRDGLTPDDVWDFEDGGRNATIFIKDLQPSSTYEIVMRYEEYDEGQPVIGTQKSVVYAVTEPEITYASAEIYMQDNVHKLVVHTVGSTFGTETKYEDWFLSMYITDNRGHAKTVRLHEDLYVKDYEYITEIPSDWNLIDGPGYEGYSVYINTKYKTPYSGVFGIQGETVRESGTYAVNNIHPTDRPRYFRWTTCADDNGHKRARAAPAVMTKAEWDALQQTVRDMIDYRGGGAEYNMGAANIGDPVSADLYDAVRTAIQGAGNGSEYGNLIPVIHKKDMMYASHFNALMDELNAASGYNVNISN